MRRRTRVVIVGGGFGGLAVAKALNEADIDLTLVDRRNHHLFQPLLYQVATGALSPANIAVPLRRILRRQSNLRVLLAEVDGIDPAHRRVRLRDAAPLDYDFLVVAAGAGNHWFGHPEWESFAPGLKSIEEATAHRARVLRAFEEAELSPAGGERAGDLTFVVVGGGPTGVETAGAIAELARDTLRHDFHRIDPTRASVVLIEQSDQLLASYPPGLARRAQQALARLGVDVRLQSTVMDIDATGVSIRTASGGETRIPSRTVVWAAGVRPGPLAGALVAETDSQLDRSGRVPVTSDLTLPGFPELFVIGDMAAVRAPDGATLPGVAPVALQEGAYVGRTILDRIAGQQSPAFRYSDPGQMATVGRGYAVFQRGRLRLTGFAGWMAWVVIHLLQIAEFENRVLVALQWAWSYVTRNRAARLIVDPSGPRDSPSVMRPDAGLPGPIKSPSDESR